jgi:type VI secretion system protein ImpA
MDEIELQALLAPLAGDAPCGPDLQFDPEFVALEEAAAGRPEREYGQTLIPAQGPDWRAVHDTALRLAARSRDLRLAVWLTRSGAHIDGLAGAVAGLRLVLGLLQQHWDQVHPQIESTGPDGATARMNALGPLVHDDGALADLRAARLTAGRNALSVRDIELALGRVEPLRGEAVPTEQGVVAGVASTIAEARPLAALMRAGHTTARGIGEVVANTAQASRSPDFQPLVRLLQRVAEAADKAAAPASAITANDAGAASPPSAAPGSGAITSRDDAIRGLERICEWIEHNEPASPAPLFIRRSQQLLKKNFIDIIRDLMPEGVKQIEHFAGKSNP